MPKKSYAPRRSARRNKYSGGFAVAPERGVQITGNDFYILHAGFHVKVSTEDVLYNANDHMGAFAEKDGFPPDGFHKGKWTKMERPLMMRQYQLFQRGSGECLQFANACSKFWYRLKIAPLLKKELLNDYCMRAKSVKHLEKLLIEHKD